MTNLSFTESDIDITAWRHGGKSTSSRGSMKNTPNNENLSEDKF